jgi:chromosome segregation and condensation protein ScpB
VKGVGASGGGARRAASQPVIGLARQGVEDRHGEEPVVTDPERSVVAWIAVIGAVSAQDVMKRFGVGRTVGYRRLRALVNHGLLSRARLVYGQPALYVATREGLASAGLPQLDTARVGVATARH